MAFAEVKLFGFLLSINALSMLHRMFHRIAATSKLITQRASGAVEAASGSPAPNETCVQMQNPA